MVGRWAAGLVRGRWHGTDIRRQPTQRAEGALGLLTHYATGVVLTAAFLQLPRGRTGRPTLAGATAYGVATSVLPLLGMFPSMGYGAFALRSGDAARVVRIMLLGHTAFGLGIGLGAQCFGLGRRGT
jgi:hypothetical protein